MKTLELSQKTLEAMRKALPNKKAETVIAIEKEAKGGWKVTLEMLERKAVPDSQDLLGIYEVATDANGDILSYKQIKRRHRVSTE